MRHTPQQNGIAERDNRTLVEVARTLLYSNTSLPLKLWAEAVSCVVYTLNRTLSTTCPTVTPFEAWFGKKPDLSNMRIFGSEFYTLVPKELRRKLDPKGILCYFVGNSDTQKGDRYWDPSTGRVNTSRDVSPINHYYEPRLPQTDVQVGVDVFSPSVPISDKVNSILPSVPAYPEQPHLRANIQPSTTASSSSKTPAVPIIRRSTRILQRTSPSITQSSAPPPEENLSTAMAVHLILADSVPDQYRDAIRSDMSMLGQQPSPKNMTP